ncbi:dUTP diphosphatase [Virgibacillus sp. Bac332]|uniref:dUTP diphosphatase n=1 Tax=Virgibacillus sp. Bac332 TaxID=2419842 RepID=UPI000EF4A8BD|nr:dUTP diphosphatase [Virgibacillus sp. Bac332]
MNLDKLFPIQKELDTRIEREKGLEGQNLLDKKILALQVELGELANEWRGFKFWSNKQKPQLAYNKGCDECIGGISKLSPLLGPYRKCEYCRVDPLLEEYVDCLHFILSIGLEIKLTMEDHVKWRRATVVEQFNDLFGYTSDLFKSSDEDWTADEQFNAYEELFAGFLGLGDMLGFTAEQIEQAYLDKNKVNHERQANGY